MSFLTTKDHSSARKARPTPGGVRRALCFCLLLHISSHLEDTNAVEVSEVRSTVRLTKIVVRDVLISLAGATLLVWFMPEARDAGIGFALGVLIGGVNTWMLVATLEKAVRMKGTAGFYVGVSYFVRYLITAGALLYVSMEYSITGLAGAAVGMLFIKWGAIIETVFPFGGRPAWE